MFCCTLLYVNSSTAIILMGKRELVALLNLSSWCLVMVERLFLAVPGGCLRFVIVVFPDHTHLLFLCLSCCLVCSLQLVVTCLGRTDLLALLYVMLSCVSVTCLCGVLGQVWHLIVFIPDKCLLPYFALL